jgi:hypothetical protein
MGRRYRAYITNGVSLLQTKLSPREGYEARRRGLEAMPRDQHMEGGHGAREPRLHRRPAPMHDALAMADPGQHGAHRLHPQTVLPRAALTQLQVGRSALGGMHARITEDQHTLGTRLAEPWAGGSRAMGGGPVPGDDPAIRVQPQTPGAADSPAMLREPLAAALRRAPTLPDGLAQLAPLGSDAPEHRWRGQAGLRPVRMGPEEPQEPRPLGEPRAPWPRVTRQAARAGPVADACQGMHPPQGAHRTGPEGGLGVGGHGAPRLIDRREQGGDTL